MLKRVCSCSLFCGCVLLLLAALLVLRTKTVTRHARTHRQQGARVALAISRFTDHCSNCHSLTHQHPLAVAVSPDEPDHNRHVFFPLSATGDAGKMVTYPVPQDVFASQLAALGQRMLELPDLANPRARRMVSEFVTAAHGISAPANHANQNTLQDAVWRIDSALRTLEHQAAPLRVTCPLQVPTQPDTPALTGVTGSPQWAALGRGVPLDTGTTALNARLDTKQPVLAQETGHVTCRRGPPATAGLDSVL